MSLGVFGKSLPGVLEAFLPSVASSRSRGCIGCNTSCQEQAATWTPRSLISHPSEPQSSRKEIPEGCGGLSQMGRGGQMEPGCLARVGIWAGHLILGQLHQPAEL